MTTLESILYISIASIIGSTFGLILGWYIIVKPLLEPKEKKDDYKPRQSKPDDLF